MSGMPSVKQPEPPWRALRRRVSSHPRGAVIACFAAVFALTLVLATRQYFLVRARELDLRSHRLELQAVALDASIRGTERQLRFLRSSAERQLARDETEAHAGDDAVRRVLQQRADGPWTLPVPASDAPIRGIGRASLLTVPGLRADETTFRSDLRLARLLSQLLPLQYQLSTDLLHTTYVSTSGIVVAYPPLRDPEIEEVVAAFAAARRLKPATLRPGEYEVAFDPIAPPDHAQALRLLFGTRVRHGGDMRGSFYFDIPQQYFQDLLHAATLPDETRVLVDADGTLIATSAPAFARIAGKWMQTLPAHWHSLATAELMQAGQGLISARASVLLYRRLSHADLLLLDYVPARSLFLSVAGQFSAPFVGVWLLLAALLWVTLTVVNQMLARQLALNAQLRELSHVDALTGLANRRRLEADYARLASKHRAGRQLSLMMIDIDHFKRVNDTWGHAAGDEVLKHLAAVTQAAVRQQDLVARFGGEEFCVLLPDTGKTLAADVAERVRLALAGSACVPSEATLPDPAPGREIRFTVSIGVAELRHDHSPDLETLVALADQRLYLAKRLGRNRVVSEDRQQQGQQEEEAAG